MENLEIISANLNGCTHNINNPKFDFGIKKCFTNAGSESSIILMTETMSDGDLRIEDNQTSYIIEGDRPGTGMCASVNVDKIEKYGKVEVKSLANKLQYILIAGIINIISIYAPQVASESYVKRDFKKNLNTVLKEIDQKNDFPIVCIGDFNVPRGEILDSYLKDTVENGFILGTNQPTQHFGNELDYCVVFKRGNLDLSISLLENATSDHDALHLKIKNLPNAIDLNECDQTHQKIPKAIPLPKNQKAIEYFKEETKRKWNAYLRENTKVKSLLQKTETSTSLCKCKKGNHQLLLADAYHNMRQIIIDAAEKCSNKRRNKKKIQPPRCNSSVFQRLYARFIGKEISKTRFRKLLKKEIEKCSQTLFASMSKVMKSSKKFYGLLKLRTTGKGVNKRQPKIPIKKVYGLYKEIYEPDNFNEQHVHQFRKKFKKKREIDSISYVRFTEDEFYNALDGVKKKKTSRGPKIEHWINSGLGGELLRLFNGCLQHGTIPNSLLTADIRLLKKDFTLSDKDEKNYRPIALVESASKILELMMRKKINWEFSKNQYAYQPKIGCLNAIKDFLLTAFKMRSETGIAYSIFLDLSKAFDKLDYNAIMNEMNDRMDYQLRRIFVEYLTSTSTNLEEYKIFPRRGIRQGGLLSPYLFLQTTDPWLRNYSGNRDEGRASGYADDTAIQTTLIQWGQKCLDSFAKFAEEKGLQVNPKKCKVVAHLSFKEYMFYSIKGRKLPTFYMNGVPLEYVREYKYLGYWITSCLTGNYQLNENFRKIKKTILQFKRFFKKAPLALLVKIASSHVSSKLYGLEFIREITESQVVRFNYFYNIWFGCKTEKANEKLQQNNQLELRNLHKKAAERYQNIESRL